MKPGLPKILHVLTGCTAVGKTELALQWAERNDAEIISCDSLLFYKGMDIGTAKPGKDELARVPHHLIDTNDLTDQMDVTRYVAAARSSAEGILLRGRKVLVTGGSGFYLRCFFHAVADDVDVQPEVRERIRGLSLGEALVALRELNPEGLGRLDLDNPRRVARALERCLSSGRTLASLAEEFARKPAPFADWEVRLVRLDRSPEELAQRIALRVRQMLADGLVAEVERLDVIGLRKNPSAARAIGYREVLDMIDGVSPAAGLEACIVANTRALVRKQRTWFRTQIPGHRVMDPGTAQVASLFT